jgi:hypothetical protein
MSAVAGIVVGRLLDRLGPRLVMTLGSLLGVAALLSVATAPSPQWFLAAWMFAGRAQSMLLYIPAFAALTRWYGPQRVLALTTRSLVAVLASRLGWRAADVVLAAMLGAVTLPLHATASSGLAMVAMITGLSRSVVIVLRVEVRAGADQRDGVRAAAGGGEQPVGARPRPDGQRLGRARPGAQQPTGGRQIFDRALFVSRAFNVTHRALPRTAGSRRDLVRALQYVTRMPGPAISPTEDQSAGRPASDDWCWGCHHGVVTSRDAYDARYPPSFCSIRGRGRLRRTRRGLAVSPRAAGAGGPGRSRASAACSRRAIHRCGPRSMYR